MARTTTNYGFNISEGTDLVNPLTDIFPNFESLDTDLKDVSDATFGVATELKTGTVHALTRDDQDKTVFKFTATANFTAGDTFTLDGAQVSALTTAGEQLTTGCYIIGSEVIVAVKGTLLTFFISSIVHDASTLEGHSASYFATASDLSDTDADVLAVSNKVGSAVLTTTAQDCSGAINELNTDLSNVGTIIIRNTLSTQGDSIAVPNDAKTVVLEMHSNTGSVMDSITIPKSMLANEISFYLNASSGSAYYMSATVNHSSNTLTLGVIAQGGWTFADVVIAFIK